MQSINDMMRTEAKIAMLHIWLKHNSSSSQYQSNLRIYENLKVQLKQKQINEQFPA